MVADREERFKYMDLLQSCISRMAKDSFMVKGWCASFVVAVMVYFLKNDCSGGAIIALVLPVLVFWKIDAFFLRTEKCYRLMYEYLIGARPCPENWVLYDLNPLHCSDNLTRKDSKGVEHIVSEYAVMRSKTLWPFYVVPILMLLIIGGEKLLQKNPTSEDARAGTSTSKAAEFRSDDGNFHYKFTSSIHK